MQRATTNKALTLVALFGLIGLNALEPDTGLFSMLAAAYHPAAFGVATFAGAATLTYAYLALVL